MSPQNSRHLHFGAKMSSTPRHPQNGHDISTLVLIFRRFIVFYTCNQLFGAHRRVSRYPLKSQIYRLSILVWLIVQAHPTPPYPYIALNSIQPSHYANALCALVYVFLCVFLFCRWWRAGAAFVPVHLPRLIV